MKKIKLVVFIIFFFNLVFAEDLLTKKQRCLVYLKNINFHESFYRYRLGLCSKFYKGGIISKNSKVYVIAKDGTPVVIFDKKMHTREDLDGAYEKCHKLASAFHDEYELSKIFVDTNPNIYFDKTRDFYDCMHAKEFLSEDDLQKTLLSDSDIEVLKKEATIFFNGYVINFIKQPLKENYKDYPHPLPDNYLNNKNSS